MFRIAISAAIRVVRPLTASSSKIIKNVTKSLSTKHNVRGLSYLGAPQQSLLNNKHILEISNNISPIQTRTVTKFSLKTGKRKTVKAATRRFFRLHWGGWIRPKVGRQKKMWKKSGKNKRRLRQHVFCTATQSFMLDKMVTKFWKRPKHYVEDPYSPYHTRSEFEYTRRQPILRN